MSRERDADLKQAENMRLARFLEELLEQVHQRARGASNRETAEAIGRSVSTIKRRKPILEDLSRKGTDPRGLD